jgi:hypothetical protein
MSVLRALRYHFFISLVLRLRGRENPYHSMLCRLTVCTLDSFNDSCRVTCDYTTRRHILRNYCSSCDCTSVSNFYTWTEDCCSSYPTIVSYDYRLGVFRSVFTIALFGTEGVARSVQLDIRSNERSFADGHCKASVNLCKISF